MFVVEVVAASDHRAVPPGSRRRAGRSRLLVPDHPLALVHPAVRQLRRGGGRGPRQGAGRIRCAGPEPRRRPSCSTGELTGELQDCTRHAAQGRRHRAGRGRRHHPVRRRGDRGRRLRQRGRDHRGIRAGHPRVRRRPLGRDRRHAGAVGLDPRADHGGARLDLPRPHDRAGRGRRAPEDPERDRPQHPARRHDASSSSSRRRRSRASPPMPAARSQ